MLPVTNSYWFRESYYLSKFCFTIIYTKWETQTKGFDPELQWEIYYDFNAVFFFFKNMFPNCKIKTAKLVEDIGSE